MNRYGYFTLTSIAIDIVNDDDSDSNSILVRAANIINQYFDLSTENDNGIEFRSPAHETEFLLKYGHLDLRERSTRTFTATWPMSDEQ